MHTICLHGAMHAWCLLSDEKLETKRSQKTRSLYSRCSFLVCRQTVIPVDNGRIKLTQKTYWVHRRSAWFTLPFLLSLEIWSRQKSPSCVWALITPRQMIEKFRIHIKRLSHAIGSNQSRAVVAPPEPASCCHGLMFTKHVLLRCLPG